MNALELILLLAILLGAVAFLGYRWFKSPSNPKGCGSGRCGCAKPGLTDGARR